MRKKYLLLLSLFLLGIKPVWAENLNLSMCEYSPLYISWSNLSNEEKQKVPMPYVCKVDNGVSSLSTNNDYELPSYSIQDKYNLAVRTQETDSCWAFGTLASIESNMIKNGVSSDYLSVAHLEFATQNSLYKPGYINFNRTFNAGGHIETTNAYILNNWGPIYDKDMSLGLLKKVALGQESITEEAVKNKKAVIDVDNIIRIRNEQGVCSTDTITSIKKYITSYGGMAATLYFEDVVRGYELNIGSNGKYDLKHKYVNGPYYYYDGSAYTDNDNKGHIMNEDQNHMVEIVGWDDTISASNFSTKPSRDGAWIVKNSYGESKYLVDDKDVNMGNNGYYYISYDDINICGNVVGYYGVNKDVSDYAYYYDDLGVNASVSSDKNVVYTANIFSKKDVKTEKLDKVTFAVQKAGYKYTVYYASNGALKNYEEIGNGVTEHNGYISVKPNKDIYVSDSFSIIVKLEGNDLNLPIAIDKDVHDMYSNYKVTKNVSYISNNGVVWSSFKNDNMNFQNSIRAYTTVTDVEFNSKVDSDLKLDDNGQVNVTVPKINENMKDGASDDIPNNPQTGIKNLFLVGIILMGLLVLFRVIRKNKMFKL